MQGIPEKNPQMAERLINASSAHKEAVRVLKTTKFVNVADLNEYISGVSNPNCRVVVQNVEQGSAIAMQLDKALEEMQKRKAAQANTNVQHEPVAPPQELINAQPRHTPVTRTAPIIVQEKAAVQTRQVPVAMPIELPRRQSFDTPAKNASHCQHIEDFDLKKGVSSLLMQMKQITLAPRMNTGSVGYDRTQQPTVDTYTPTADSQILKEESTPPLANMVTTEQTRTPIDTTEITNRGHMASAIVTSTKMDSFKPNAEPVPQNKPIETTVKTVQAAVLEKPLSEPKTNASLHQQTMQKLSEPVDRFNGNTPIETPNAAYDIYTSTKNDDKLVKRYTPSMKTTNNQNNEVHKQGEMKPNVPKNVQQQQQPNNIELPVLPKTQMPTCTSRSMQTHKAGSRRKAVVIGCTYFGDNEAVLRGACNDATLFATTLVTHMGFDVDDIVLLIDTEPASVYTRQLSVISSSQHMMNTARRNSGGARKPGVIGGLLGGLIEDVFTGYKADAHLDIPEMLVLDSPGDPIPECNKPTHANILKALKWLTAHTKPGDHGILYFSGHSVQTDDMSGWEGEGYDEALVPCDYMASGDPSRGIIPAQQIKHLIQSVDKNCQMTVIMDTVGMQTMLDPASRIGPWKYIKGAMLHGMWPLVDATGKINRAAYDSEVWRDIAMQQQLVRPKFMPMLQVDCAAAIVDGYISSKHPTTSSNIICIAAAPFQDVAIEALFRPMDLTGGILSARKHNDCEEVVCHGVFTYCMISTMTRDRASKRGGLTVKELIYGIHKRCKYLKATRLPKLQQVCEATIHPSGLATLDDFFLSPWAGRVLMDRHNMAGPHYPYKALNTGINSFLSLHEAWVQMHNEGRAKAVEQREMFGRMRSAVINVDRMVTADARNMMFMNQQPHNSRAPSSNVMIGHVPTQQRVAAGNSWFGQAPAPQYTMPVRQEYMMGHNAPMMRQQAAPAAMTPMHHHYHPMPQDYVLDQVMFSPQHMMQEPQHYVTNQQAVFYNQQHVQMPPQFGGPAQPAFLHYTPQKPQVVAPTKLTKPCRSSTSSMFDMNGLGKPMVPRNSTSTCKHSGYKLAEPLTTALISQLPVSQHYY